jgi:hypothetical protein
MQISWSVSLLVMILWCSPWTTCQERLKISRLTKTSEGSMICFLLTSKQFVQNLYLVAGLGSRHSVCKFSGIWVIQCQERDWTVGPIIEFLTVMICLYIAIRDKGLMSKFHYLKQKLPKLLFITYLAALADSQNGLIRCSVSSFYHPQPSCTTTQYSMKSTLFWL